MGDDLLFAEHNDFNFESKLIRNDSKNIYNRLRSIVDDASFVMEVADMMSELALIANERCGSWYIDRTKKKAYSTYFKSTDGHMHMWDFNIRRNNLHLIPMITQHHGCIIVDSTRKGKKIPDALSKTIPIWCATLNRALAKGRPDWDTQFHSLPSAVSRSEHAQIEARIDSFVDKLVQSSIDLESLEQLKKPLRPIWLTPQSYDALSPPVFDQETPFYPVICLSASEAVASGYQSRPGYLYVQGSGDDQEAWSLGLTSLLFWEHHATILANASTCEQAVRDIVALSRQEATKQEAEFTTIQPTLLGIGNHASGLCWQDFDVIINCSEHEHAENKGRENYLHLPVPEGKKGQIVFGSSIQKAIDFVREPLLNQKRILVHGRTGKDYAVGLLLSILVYFYDLQGQWVRDTKPRVDKKTIQHQLVRIIANWDKASPSRTTLKRVNTYFMSHS
ncbi:hypothetical protein CU098_010189 [Rhizopus stolonifer]|uniref:Initiator tRNA phosphoribosyl transferase n=1 Tax=Rhizopus stolonifer TaxID=4846 RepID=A0A367KHN5_RHIST|nr:hypothetical protein CU098_010189 [Rhizopus stolonifer]